MKSPQHLYIGRALFLFRRHEHPTLCWIVFVLELEESLQVQCSFAFSVCSLLLLDYCVCDRCIDIKTERFQAVQESAQYLVVEQQKQKVQPVPGREIGNRASTQAPLSQQKE